MMFRDDTPRPPSSAGAPGYLAVCAGYATELEYPRAVRLIGAIAFDRAPLNRYPKPTNLGEDVKGNEETREQGAHCSLSLDRFSRPLHSCLNLIGVEMIEDPEVFFVASIDFRCENRTVQGSLGSGNRSTRLAGIACVSGEFLSHYEVLPCAISGGGVFHLCVHLDGS